MQRSFHLNDDNNTDEWVRVDRGTFTKDDVDVNEIFKKATGLDWPKKKTLHLHHTFLYISLPSLHDYDVKFHVLWRTQTQDNDFLVLFLNFDTVFTIQLQKNKIASN